MNCRIGNVYDVNGNLSVNELEDHIINIIWSRTENHLDKMELGTLD